MKSQELKDKWTGFKTDLKSKWEKITDEDIRHIDGDLDKFAEKIEERYGKRQAEVLKWAEDWKTPSKAKVGAAGPSRSR